jgi:hypothetical protein
MGRGFGLRLLAEIVLLGHTANLIQA